MITQQLDLRADLFLRDRARWWRMTVAGEQAESIVAAASADPRTVEEFQSALLRFFDPSSVPPIIACESPPVCPGPRSNRHVALIDLPRRTIRTTWEPPQVPRRVATWQATGPVAPLVPYTLPSDWTWQLCDEHANADVTPDDDAPPHTCDWHEELYGRPLQEFLLATAAGLDVPFNEESIESLARINQELVTDAVDLTVEVHQTVRQQIVDWLNQPTPTLTTATRRLFLVRDAQKVDRDLDDRAEQWSLLGERPSGISEPTTHQLHHGPGPIEAILYVDLLRFLLLRVCRQVALQHEVTPALLREWLHGWFETDGFAFSGFTTRTIIDSERQRLPLQLPDSYRMIDCDCPLCRLAAADRPAFECLTVDDFSLPFNFPKFWSTADHLDWFALNSSDRQHPESLWEDGDEVEFERSRDLPFRVDPEIDLFSEANDLFLGELADPSASSGDPESPTARRSPSIGRQNLLDESLWKNVFLAPWDGPMPVGVRVFAIAACAGELIENLKQRSARRPLIDLVLEQVDRLTSSMRTQQADFILESIVTRFCEALDDVEREHPDLGPKIQDLQSRVIDFVAS